MTGRAVEEELLRRLPSQEDDIDRELEAQLRCYGAESIQRAGVLLRVPQITIVSACAIFQHFYCRRSFAEFDVQGSSCGCLLLACKLEETHRKLRDVVQVFYRVQMRAHEEKGELAYVGKPTPFLDLTSREYVEMKQEVIRAERHVLLELGFEVEKLQEHPHRHLLELAELLGLKPGGFLQKAWNYLNDSLRSHLVCAHEPRVIAAAALLLAARALGHKLPSLPPWWQVVGLELEDIRHIAKSILALYRRPPAQYVYVERRKKPKVEPLVAALGPATPFPETPAPAMSPLDDDDNGADPASQIIPDPASQPQAQQDTVTGADGDRLAEMLDEQRGDAAAAAVAGVAPARPASGKAVSGGGDRTTATDDEARRKGKKDSDRKTTGFTDDKDRRGRDKEKEKDKERERERVKAQDRDKKRAREKRGARSASSGGSSSNTSRSRSAAKRAKTATKPRAAVRGRERKGAARRSASSSSTSHPARRGKRSVDSREI